jgi:dihydroorotate dehydrogenase
LTERDVRDVASAARKAKVDGIIVSNTTIERPDGVRAHAHGGEAGGLSGAPLMDASTEMLRLVYSATGGAIPLVGCGGVSDGRTRTARSERARPSCSCTRRSRTRGRACCRR